MIMIRLAHNCNQANELDINIRSKKEICYLAVCTSPITITDRYHLKYIFLDCLRFFRILETNQQQTTIFFLTWLRLNHQWFLRDLININKQSLFRKKTEMYSSLLFLLERNQPFRSQITFEKIKYNKKVVIWNITFEFWHLIIEILKMC
jgi:hypothetical protein